MFHIRCRLVTEDLVTPTCQFLVCNLISTAPGASNVDHRFQAQHTHFAGDGCTVEWPQRLQQDHVQVPNKEMLAQARQVLCCPKLEELLEVPACQSAPLEIPISIDVVPAATDNKSHLACLGPVQHGSLSSIQISVRIGPWLACHRLEGCASAVLSFFDEPATA